MSEANQRQVPWYLDKKEDWKVRCDNHSVIAEFNSAEDASYAVRAVNLYQHLVAVLAFLIEAAETEPRMQIYRAHIQEAQIILEQARGRP